MNRDEMKAKMLFMEHELLEAMELHRVLFEGHEAYPNNDRILEEMLSAAQSVAVLRRALDQLQQDAMARSLNVKLDAARFGTAEPVPVVP